MVSFIADQNFNYSGKERRASLLICWCCNWWYWYVKWLASTCCKCVVGNLNTYWCVMINKVLMNHFPCTISSIIITTVLTLLYSTRELCYACISFIPSVWLTWYSISPELLPFVFNKLLLTSKGNISSSQFAPAPTVKKGYCTVHQNTVTAPYFICWHSMYPFGWSISILITVMSLPFHRIHIDRLFMLQNMMSIVLIGYLAFLNYLNSKVNI